MTYSRLIGGLFLAGFLVYGVGSAMATSAAGAALSKISAGSTILVVGAVLMLLAMAVDVGKAVLFFPILEKHAKRTALGYLATMIVEVCFLGLGAFFLLMIVPLARHAGEGWANGLGSLLVQANLTAYTIGEAVLGFGALFLCALLWRSGLIPGWLAISGLIGYVCLMTGQIAALFGAVPNIGIYSVIPGTFFEFAMPAWLIVKGFRPAAYAGKPLTQAVA